MPGKATDANDTTTYKMRTSAGSQPRNSAIPPHTPAMTRLCEWRSKGMS